jgi:8-oxo-dGTP pyrophosphatase MutT (NUDIX family)
MALVDHDIYVVVVLSVGGSNASYIKLVLGREPLTGKVCFHVGIVLPNRELVDAAVRELFEEIGRTLTVDYLTMLSGALVCVFLHIGKY